MGSVFQELARERQENFRLLKALQDKDDLIGKLKEEVDLLNRVSPAYCRGKPAVSCCPPGFCPFHLSGVLLRLPLRGFGWTFLLNLGSS